jgi:hypothetical protein
MSCTSNRQYQATNGQVCSATNFQPSDNPTTFYNDLCIFVPNSEVTTFPKLDLRFCVEIFVEGTRVATSDYHHFGSAVDSRAAANLAAIIKKLKVERPQARITYPTAADSVSRQSLFRLSNTNKLVVDTPDLFLGCSSAPL